MKGGNQLRSEREKLYNKLRQMEQDIALLENNIGFFSKSKNAENLIADVREKIARAKSDMAGIIEKIRVIDEQETK
jgi:ribosome-interacting GTPase 1